MSKTLEVPDKGWMNEGMNNKQTKKKDRTNKQTKMQTHEESYCHIVKLGLRDELLDPEMLGTS